MSNLLCITTSNSKSVLSKSVRCITCDIIFLSLYNNITWSRIDMILDSVNNSGKRPISNEFCEVLPEA